jgi:exodeoxyribonuclease X
VLLTIDLETTGLDHKTDSVVEIAAVQVIKNDRDQWTIGQGSSSLVAPGRRVPPEARAVHHLSDEQLRSAPQLPMAVADVMMAVDKRGERIECVVAHNAAFDRGFLGAFFPSSMIWLDTMRCAQHIWPDAPSYGNMALFYWLNLERNSPLPDLPPHRALYDATVTANLLLALFDNHSLEDLIELQTKPVLQRICRFGKHRNVAWSEVPRDYLRWVLGQDNPPFEDDVRHTASYWLGY